MLPPTFRVLPLRIVRDGLLAVCLFASGLITAWADDRVDTTAVESRAAAVESGAAPSSNTPPRLDPVFQKITPAGVDDLRAIERHVTQLVERVTECTVGIRIGRAAGSGVIVSEDGYVLCAAHVGGRPGRRVTVILPDGRELRGETLGANRRLDASLIKISDEGDWPFAEMGKLEQVKAGDWCVAVGHPGGYQRGRTPVVRLGRVILARQQVVQTDCVLVGGDSGGPLFDMQGRVIGIHSRIGTSSTWNFHVPISAYHNDWNRLVAAEEWGDDQQSTGAVMGVSGDRHPQGCRITDVARGLPAQQAGILIGDVITKFDGRPVDSFNGLVELIGRKKPGDEVEVEILRGNETLTKKVVLKKP